MHCCSIIFKEFHTQEDFMQRGAQNITDSCRMVDWFDQVPLRVAMQLTQTLAC